MQISMDLAVCNALSEKQTNIPTSLRAYIYYCVCTSIPLNGGLSVVTMAIFLQTLSLLWVVYLFSQATSEQRWGDNIKLGAVFVWTSVKH